MTEQTYKELKRYVDSRDDFTEDLINYGYTKGRAEAERDFQNSDYWNDYLSEVIADARANAFNEFVESYREFINAPCDDACFKKEIDECDGICIDCFEKWYKEAK